MALDYKYDAAKFKIKDGVLMEPTKVRIEYNSKLLKYNPNWQMISGVGKKRTLYTSVLILLNEIIK